MRFVVPHRPIAFPIAQNAIFHVLIETFLSTQHRLPYGAQCVGPFSS